MFDLRQIRKKRGMSLRRLAKQTGVDRKFLVLIENMERQPSVEVAKRIAEALEFPWIQFFEQ